MQSEMAAFMMCGVYPLPYYTAPGLFHPPLQFAVAEISHIVLKTGILLCQYLVTFQRLVQHAVVLLPVLHPAIDQHEVPLYHRHIFKMGFGRLVLEQGTIL